MASRAASASFNFLQRMPASFTRVLYLADHAASFPDFEIDPNNSSLKVTPFEIFGQLSIEAAS